MLDAFEIEDKEESIGINNRINLADALQVLQKRINQHWMLEGVTMIDPQRVHIESGVTLGKDTGPLSGSLPAGQHNHRRRL